MRNVRISLHMDKKRALLIIGLFILMSVLPSAILVRIVDLNLSELETLNKSKYLYSAITQNSLEQDSYYIFNSNISFLKTNEAARSINAEVIMQGKNTGYTDLVVWNTRQLANGEIAVSSGVAHRYNLKIGDCLYSKRAVDNQIIEYTIAEILPGILSTRVSDASKYGTGIIIMAYDAVYVDNMMHTSIIYTDSSPDYIYSEYSDMPQKMIYREDEMKKVCLSILPYILVFTVLSIIAVCIFEWIWVKGFRHNFKRIITLGFDKGKLDRTYFRYANVVGLLSLLISFSITICVSFIMKVSIYSIIMIVIINLFSAIVLNFYAGFIKRHLWR